MEIENANVHVEEEDRQNQTKMTCSEERAEAEKRERGTRRLIINSCERE